MRDAYVTYYSAAQVGELDRRIIQDCGIPGFELMQRAASAAFYHLQQRWPDAQRLFVFCGPGNNGGDGFLLAQLALAAGLDVRVFLLSERCKSAGDAAKALATLESAGGTPEPLPESLVGDCDVAVDAMLGSGLARAVEGRYAGAVDWINQADAGVFAVDIPTGLDADTGKIWGAAVMADATSTFIGRKLGLSTGRGPACAGQMEFADLDVPAAVYSQMDYLARAADAAMLSGALPVRPRDAHKGDNGHVLCVGGNRGMAGAVRMAGEAALRTGAGLVSVATRPEHAVAMAQARPELMAVGITQCADLEHHLARASVAAIGPGLGADVWASALFGQVLETDMPLVVDADALNLLASEPVARGNWILTPHPGEAARLLACSTVDIQNDRPAAVARLADRFNAVVVLKGAGSLIHNGNSMWLCAAGNPGMAVGGMGDVLTGVIAALLAQGLSLSTAACCGVYLHAAAADEQASHGERGLLPTDLFPAIRRLANP